MTYDITIFGLHLSLSNVAFSIGGFKVYWYGICILTGFVLALIYAMRSSKRFGLDSSRMLDVVIVATPVAILCARLYYVIFNGNISDFIHIRDGGLAIYGGIIGAFAAGVVMCKIRKVNVLDMFDIAALGFLIGQACGRWGNFFNQEAFGTPTGSEWFGMSSIRTGGVNVHPCFLYESLWCVLGFIVLHILSKHRKFKGEIFLSYTAWYGFGRFFIEGLRTDSLMLGALRVSQILAALSFAAAAALLIIMFIQDRKGKLPQFVRLAQNDGAAEPETSSETDGADGDLTPSEYSEIISEMERENGDMTEDELGENAGSIPADESTAADCSGSSDELGENN